MVLFLRAASGAEDLLDEAPQEGVRLGRLGEGFEEGRERAPANRFALASCWIHRRHEQEGFGATADPGVVPRHDFRFTSMAEMVEAHRREVGG